MMLLPLLLAIRAGDTDADLVARLQKRDPQALAELYDRAGAIFLGHTTPVALGDYVAGPSHVLPTGGTARFASGLSANDFLRRSSVLSFTQAGLEAMADDVRLLAGKEGLTAHARSVEVRLPREPRLDPDAAVEPAVQRNGGTPTAVRQGR